MLQREKIVGWVQARMEFGPRALRQPFHPRRPALAEDAVVMNLKVKFPRVLSPFAPVVRCGAVSDYFELDCESPYMLLVAPVIESLRTRRAQFTALPNAAAGDSRAPNLVARVNQTRSTIPAVTHVDYSARIQTVTREENARLYTLLERWETGQPAAACW